jgi:hypothetical protein
MSSDDRGLVSAHNVGSRGARPAGGRFAAEEAIRSDGLALLQQE